MLSLYRSYQGSKFYHLMRSASRLIIIGRIDLYFCDGARVQTFKYGLAGGMYYERAHIAIIWQSNYLDRITCYVRV